MAHATGEIRRIDARVLVSVAWALAMGCGSHAATVGEDLDSGVQVQPSSVEPADTTEYLCRLLDIAPPEQGADMEAYDLLVQRTETLTREEVSEWSTEDLVVLYAWTEDADVVGDEVVLRGGVQEVLCATEDGQDFITRQYQLYRLLERIDDPLVEEGLRRNATPVPTVRAFISLMHFARRGKRWALKALNDNYRLYSVCSYTWAGTLKVFGEFRYKPAAENMARDLESACMNVGCAGQESLQAIYPEADPPAIPEGAEEYWLGYIERARAR